MDLGAFFNMGGYAFYVWTAYGLALAVLLINLVFVSRRKKQVLRNVTRLLRQETKPR